MIVTPGCICVSIIFTIILIINSMVIILGNIDNSSEMIKIGIILMVITIFVGLIASALCFSINKQYNAPINTPSRVVQIENSNRIDMERQDITIIHRSDSAREYTR